MATFPSDTTADGIWTLKKQKRAQQGGDWPVIYVASPDPNFNQVSLLLNGDGTDGGQNNTYTDSSVNDLTLSATSDITQGSFNPFGDNWSVYVSGVDTQGFTTSTSSWGDFGTGDFSIEAWIYPEEFDSVGGFRIFDTRASASLSAWMFGVRNSSNPFIDFMYGNARINGSIVISLNTWTHIAVTRESGTVRLFVNGVLDTSATITSSINCGTSTPRILKIIDSGASPKGYASNIRVVKGTAIYTSAFTPPTEILTAISGTSLLICQSYGFKDASTNDYALTVNGTPKITRFSPFAPTASYDAASLGGSAYFPNTTTSSTGHQFSTPATADLDIGSGDFTIECFYYPTSIQNYSRVLWFNETWSNINAAGFAYGSPTGGKLNFVANGIANPMVSTNNDMELFCWYHIAVTRTGNEFAMYVDGVKQTSTYTSSSEIFPTSTPILYVGNGPTSVGGWSPLQGYVANARVVKGTAVYSTDFTPPTAPVTAVSGTAALIDFADAAIPDYSTINNVNTVGNADISTAVVKYGTGSLAFDGTGDYLSTPSTPVFGTGDFTIEFWVYFNAVNNSTVKYLYDFRNASATSASFFAQEATNGWTYLNGASASISTGWNSGTFTTDTWYHVAISRSSGTTKFFVDGTVTSSVADTSNYANETFILASRYSAENFLNGYIDDLRITNGLARYTANFTPPTEALPTF